MEVNHDDINSTFSYYGRDQLDDPAFAIVAVIAVSIHSLSTIRLYTMSQQPCGKTRACFASIGARTPSCDNLMHPIAMLCLRCSRPLRSKNDCPLLCHNDVIGAGCPRCNLLVPSAAPLPQMVASLRNSRTCRCSQ